MEIRDPIHGPIHILNEEIPIIEDCFFQRLRSIKQLGFSEYVFPGATHTRFLHSLGVMGVAQKVFRRLFHAEIHQRDSLRLEETFKLACLLHDIGHAPLSHSTESVMPKLRELRLPKRFLGKEEKNLDRQASHEDYTIKSITESSLGLSLTRVERSFGVNKHNIAELIVGQTTEPEYFTIKNVNYFPLLHQLVTSELDCDRMDYLLRDSYFCGVSYGQFDLNWIVDNLKICLVEGSAYLGISERAVATFDDFLLSRFHMFLMVYFHYRAVCLEQLLLRYFKTAPNEYSIPADIQEYQRHDDYYLMEILRSSSNKYARQIVRNSIPTKIFEGFGVCDLELADELENFMKDSSIEYIRSSSKSRLSKYCNVESEKENYPILVVKEFPRGGKKYVNLLEATDLFQKYSDAHIVTRLHCHIEELGPEIRKKMDAIVNKK